MQHKLDEALKEYNNFMGLFWMYKQDAVDNFVSKYPMFRDYKHLISCRDATTDFEDSVVDTDVLFEIRFDWNVKMTHLMSLVKTNDLFPYNHTISDVSNGLVREVTVRLKLKRFYYSPRTGKIDSF